MCSLTFVFLLCIGLSCTGIPEQWETEANKRNTKLAWAILGKKKRWKERNPAISAKLANMKAQNSMFLQWIFIYGSIRIMTAPNTDISLFSVTDIAEKGICINNHLLSTGIFLLSICSFLLAREMLSNGMENQNYNVVSIFIMKDLVSWYNLCYIFWKR